MKLFWVDCETTGLDCNKHEILTFAGMVEIDGKIKEEFSFKCRPERRVDADALKINGLKPEDIEKFPPAVGAYHALLQLLARYIDRYDTNDKFIMAGQNVKFDLDFLKKFFEKNGDKYFGSWFWYHTFDTMSVAMIAKYCGILSVPNFKLTSLASACGVKFNAHDALEDIKTSRIVAMKLIEGLSVSIKKS